MPRRYKIPPDITAPFASRVDGEWKGHTSADAAWKRVIDSGTTGNSLILRATEPRVALQYAAAHLTPARLDACAQEESWAALQYAAPHLTPERLDACAQARPWTALTYAASHLTPERLAWCKEQAR